MARIKRCDLAGLPLFSHPDDTAMFALRSARTQAVKIPLQSALSSLRYNSTEAELKAKHSANSVVNSWKTGSKPVQSEIQLPMVDAPANTQSPIIEMKLFTEAREVAKSIQVTGPIAGRMVNVDNGDIDGAFRRLRTVVNANNIRFDKQQQKYYKKPGKVLEEKRIRRKKRLFDEGIRRLMNIVKEAKRRGY